jgi:ubiquinone biosynthesis protein Coq4
MSLYVYMNISNNIDLAKDSMKEAINFNVPAGATLRDAYTLFMDTFYKKFAEPLTQEKVHKVVQFLENPKYKITIFGYDFFPGRVNLDTHDHLHVLCGCSADTRGEAFVIATTMSSTGKMTKFKAFLYLTIINWFAPKMYHLKSADKKIFYSVIGPATTLAKQGVLKDFSTYDLNNHLDESVDSIREKLGIQALRDKFDFLR